jgi:hypothetical protein
MNGSPAEYFFVGGFVVFCRGFCEKGGLIVVFWWCGRGGWVVKRGVLAVSFLASKDAPRFLSLFFGVPVLGMREVYGPVGVNRT